MSEEKPDTDIARQSDMYVHRDSRAAPVGSCYSQILCPELVIKCQSLALIHVLRGTVNHPDLCRKSFSASGYAHDLCRILLYADELAYSDI